MYKIRIDLTYVHVHPMNRDGVGVYHSEVVALLSDIADAGPFMVLCPLYAANC